MTLDRAGFVPVCEADFSPGPVRSGAVHSDFGPLLRIWGSNTVTNMPSVCTSSMALIGRLWLE